MGCCSEQTVSLGSTNRDPFKHVNYAKGMVLGVDDLTQEFAYLSGRSEWLVRDAIGFGTVAGLAVKAEEDGANGPRVRVTSGSAMSPRGMPICVRSDQCASLNAWLKKLENSKAISARLGTASPAFVTLYVKLCFASCTTDNVPIPGEPCRAENLLMAPSRVADDFSLELSLDPPSQQEERALRDFVEWLRGIHVDDLGSPLNSTEAELLQALRDAAKPWFDYMNAPASPPSPPHTIPSPPSDFLFGSPPASLHVHPDRKCDLLRVAFRFWVTELRPMWMARCCACAGIEQPADDCVLLAALQVPVVRVASGGGAAVWEVNGKPKDIQIDERARPFLVHQRMLQEWLLCGICDRATAGGLGVPTLPGLQTTGGVQIRVDSFTGNVKLDSTMHCVICGGANFEVGLPKCSDHAGRVYIVRSLSDTCTLAASGTDQVESAAGFISKVPVKKGQSVTVVSDGRNKWFVVGTGAVA
jgi:hypothetical protein